MTDGAQSGALENVDGDDPVEEDYQVRNFIDRMQTIEPGDHTVISLGKKVDDGSDADSQQ